MSKRMSLRPCLVLLLAVAAAGAAAPPAPRSDRAALAAEWQKQGLQALPSRGLDLVYVRPGVLPPTGVVLQVAPVKVELDPDWQRANPSLHRARLRPAEVQQLKDEVAAIVAGELREQLGQERGAAAADAPVLEARVLDLYLNAPEMQMAAMTRTYTRSFGDMVLVAELRSRDGTLLFASWEHRPPREFASLRLTTRVENAIELRHAAQAWARQLRRELDRLATGA